MEAFLRYGFFEKRNISQYWHILGGTTSFKSLFQISQTPDKTNPSPPATPSPPNADHHNSTPSEHWKPKPIGAQGRPARRHISPPGRRLELLGSVSLKPWDSLYRELSEGYPKTKFIEKNGDTAIPNTCKYLALLDFLRSAKSFGETYPPTPSWLPQRHRHDRTADAWHRNPMSVVLPPRP